MKLIALLKYLDQKKITAEAVMEIAAAIGRSPTLEQAAEVANAFKTRGATGILPLVPTLLSWPKAEGESPQESKYVNCPKCGHWIEV